MAIVKVEQAAGGLVEAEDPEAPDTLTDDQLMAELRRRYLVAAEELDGYLKEIEGIPWLEVAERLYARHVDQPLPEEVKRAAALSLQLGILADVTIAP